MEAYVPKEYPRMVYGPEGERKVIQSEAEWPEGYKTHPDEFNDDAAKAVIDAEKAVADAEEAEKEGIRAFLDANKVDYHPNLGLVKLRVLSDQLKAHLEGQANGDSA